MSLGLITDGAADLLREAPLDGPGAAVPAQRPGLAPSAREGPDIAGRGGPGRDDGLVALARGTGPGSRSIRCAARRSAPSPGCPVQAQPPFLPTAMTVLKPPNGPLCTCLTILPGRDHRLRGPGAARAGEDAAPVTVEPRRRRATDRGRRPPGGAPPQASPPDPGLIRRNVPINPVSNVLFQLNRPNSTVRPIFRGVPLTSLLVRLLTAGLQLHRAGHSFVTIGFPPGRGRGKGREIPSRCISGRPSSSAGKGLGLRFPATSPR